MDIGEIFIGIKTIKNTELFYASTICGNREIEQLYTTSQVSNKTRKTKLSHISGHVFQD